MAARGGRLYLGLTFPSTQGRELICRAACFLSPAPQKLALQGKETRHIILFFPPPRCPCCAMEYNLTVTRTAKQGGGQGGLWCRRDRGIWSKAILRALGRMTNIGKHKPPRVSLATVNAAKPREVFLATSQRFNLI